MREIMGKSRLLPNIEGCRIEKKLSIFYCTEDGKNISTTTFLGISIQMKIIERNEKRKLWRIV